MGTATEPRLVVPGDLLGTAEEFVPGQGTYEDNGRIYSALLGRSRVDPRTHSISVDAVHAVPMPREGERILGRVDEIKSAMAIVSVLASPTTGRTVPGAPEGTIHVSKVKDGYTESLQTEFAPGDIVLAKVIQSRPGLKLSTAAPELGVVSARCQRCHGILGPPGRGGELVCPRCGNRERRKAAREYGGRQS
jgi:exosome complex component CSL4